MDTPLAHQPAPTCGGAEKGEPWGSVVLPPQPVTPTQALQVPRPTLPWHPPALAVFPPCPRWPWQTPPCLTLHPESSLALRASPPIIGAGAEGPVGRGARGLEALRPGEALEGQARGYLLSACLHPWGPQSHPRELAWPLPSQQSRGGGEQAAGAKTDGQSDDAGQETTGASSFWGPPAWFAWKCQTSPVPPAELTLWTLEPGSPSCGPSPSCEKLLKHTLPRFPHQRRGDGSMDAESIL